MLDENAIFYGRKADVKALVEYGFICADGVYTYCKDILNGQFMLRIKVRENAVSAEVIDTETDSPYYLFKVEGAEGAFVGEVRSEYERVLTDVADKCFSAARPYRESVTNDIIKYATEKYATPLEFLWNDENAVMRRADNRKWYLIFLKVKAARLGLDGEGMVEIIDLRIEKGGADALVDGVNFLPAYHMNKQSWITIPLDGRVSAERVRAFVDASYALAGAKK